MRQVVVTISQASDGTFWCSTEEDVYGGGLTAAGRSVKEAKEDLMVCLEEAKADFAEQGGTPEQVSFLFKYDLQSFFDYFSFLNITDIARRAGINPSLMRQYARGLKTAGEKTYNRLSACMTAITAELQAAAF